MTKLNRKVEYALMALKFMSGKRPGELVTASDVVAVTGGPFDGMARVLQVMAQNGLLRSEQGAHGGYSIVRDLSRVSLYELMEMILGPMGVVKCLNEQQACELVTSCNILSPIQTLNRKLGEFYRGLSLAEVLRLNMRESAS